MFRITRGSGFQMDLPNGITVSVQFGPGNYCDHKMAGMFAPKGADVWESRLAECAAWREPGHKHVKVPGFCEYDDVEGCLDVEEVLEFINKASKIGEADDL